MANAQDKLILDYVVEHERQRANQVFMTQPLGGDRVDEFTWARTVDEARRMATHLRSHGFPRGARIAILSKNCAHFMVAELAIWLAGYTTVAIFPTEIADTVKFVLEHSEASLLFVGKLDTWDRQEPGVPAGLPRIAFPLAPSTAFSKWDDIVAANPPLTGAPDRRGDELAMIIYTSGSTGQPKGAMLQFQAVTRAAEGVVSELKAQTDGVLDYRALSYLPLAHIFERTWIEAAAFVSGAGHIYFAETLETFVKDLNRAKPTIFISVPRLWLKFQQGVFAKMPPAKLNRLLSIPILGKIVARKVLTGLGLEHVKLAGSGSAPIPPDLIAWYRRLGLKLMEGYAMTEDAAYSHSSKDGFNEPGYVGVPMPGVQVKLSDQGEILIKSPGAFSGYFKQPDLTAQCFTEDGFFRTGDVGERRPNGMLKLTGRAKEQFKTAKGKYVAPAPIENRLNAHSMVELSLVSGVGQQSAYAIVVLAETLRPRLGDAGVRAEVESELGSLLSSVNRDLADYEQLRMIVVAREPWSIENRCLTPTMKIRRSAIEAAVAPKVDAWFSGKGPVLWA
jgi:long-subunit acyl-CoA synthetase (AMP-forming)